MGHDQIVDMLEEYALGSLTPVEKEKVDSHLRECADCRNRAAEYNETISMLASAVEAIDEPHPPARLKSDLMHKLENEPRISKKPSSAPAPLWIWAVAASVLLLVSVLLNVRFQSAVENERMQVRELLTQLGKQEIVLEVVDAPTADRKILLPPKGVENEMRSYGKVFTAQLPYVVIMVARLPQPPPGASYHLWYGSGGNSVFGGLISVNEDGFGLLVLETDAPLQFEEVRLTVQTPGSEIPSQQVVLAWPTDRSL